MGVLIAERCGKPAFSAILYKERALPGIFLQGSKEIRGDSQRSWMPVSAGLLLDYPQCISRSHSDRFTRE